jgi:RNA polymerase sigma-70 factor, ECF subfamily
MLSDLAPKRAMSMEQVASTIGALPDEDREVLQLVCCEGWSYHETAAIIGIRVEIVRQRLLRARRALLDLPPPAGE